MQQAVPVGEGAMAALLGADLALAQRSPRPRRRAKSAPSPTTMTRARSSCPATRARSTARSRMAKEMGAKRAVLLPVSAPFHCPLMQPAADAMARGAGNTTSLAPAVPVFANVTAAPESDPDTIRNLLVEQVTGMVRWRESVAQHGGEPASRNSWRWAARSSGRWSSASRPTPR